MDHCYSVEGVHLLQNLYSPSFSSGWREIWLCGPVFNWTQPQICLNQGGDIHPLTLTVAMVRLNYDVEMTVPNIYDVSLAHF